MKLIIRKLKILKKYSYPYLVFKKLKIISPFLIKKDKSTN